MFIQVEGKRSNLTRLAWYTHRKFYNKKIATTAILPLRTVRESKICSKNKINVIKKTRRLLGCAFNRFFRSKKQIPISRLLSVNITLITLQDDLVNWINFSITSYHSVHIRWKFIKLYCTLYALVSFTMIPSTNCV